MQAKTVCFRCSYGIPPILPAARLDMPMTGRSLLAVVSVGGIGHGLRDKERSLDWRTSDAADVGVMTN